jgi:hypothetical protein
MRWLASIVIGVWLASSGVPAQEITNTVPTTTTNQTSALQAPPEKNWSFSLSASTYIVPDSSDYVQPTLTVDRRWLPFEARYNYEAADTGSAWIGYNFSAGEKVSIELTPMLGAVFGDTTGIAPGYKLTLGWWKLELYSEGEYVFDTHDSSESYFYTWSEFTLAPVDWFRFGLVVQRTKLYETDFDIQRGVLAGFSFKHLDLSAYVFNPDDDPTVVLGVAANF